jgi:outer membrane protein assembly factor BamB
LSSKFSLLSLSFAALLFAGCASRNIHKGEASAPEVLRRQWTYPVRPLSTEVGLGVEYASPVFHENSLLIGSARYGLISLYPGIQAERFKLPLPNGVMSEIENSQDSIVFVSGEGEVTHVDPSTGKVRWKTSVRNPIASRPRLGRDRVFVTTSDDVLVALDRSTGKMLWSYRRRNLAGPTISRVATPLLIGDQLWAGFADGGLVVLSEATGKVLWERVLSTGKKFNDLDAEPVRDGDRVYWPAYDGALLALSVSDGQELWSLEGAGGAHQVRVDGDRLYVSSSQGKVIAVDRRFGRPLWEFSVDSGVPGEVALVGGSLIVPSSSEYLYALDPSNGKLLSRIHVGYQSGLTGKVAVDPSRPWFYAMTHGGNLMAISVQENHDK